MRAFLICVIAACSPGAERENGVDVVRDAALVFCTSEAIPTSVTPFRACWHSFSECDAAKSSAEAERQQRFRCVTTKNYACMQFTTRTEQKTIEICAASYGECESVRLGVTADPEVMSATACKIFRAP